MKKENMKLFESIQLNLKESVSLPEGYETFTDFEVGKNYNPSQSACKLNAMKAYVDDNNEDIYVGSVKVNGEEILHFFNVKGGKVIDHSGTANAEGNEMSEYKGVNISGPLKAKGYTPYTQELQDASFQNEKGNIIKVVGGGFKPRFFFNDEEISYEDLKNINESEDCIKEDIETELNDYNTDIKLILDGIEKIRPSLKTEEGHKILDNYVYISVSNAINDLGLDVDDDTIG